MTEITVYTYAVPIIIALILGETIYSNAKGLNYYKLNDTLGSYGLLAGNVVISLLTKGSFLLFNIYLYQFRLFTINDLMNVFCSRTNICSYRFYLLLVSPMLT